MNGVVHIVHVGDGRIVLPRATYELYMPGAGSAALLAREEGVLLLPLNGPVAGGLLLKQRNLAGDRVMLAEEFLAARGLGRFTAERRFNVRWLTDAGALLIEGLEAARS